MSFGATSRRDDLISLFYLLVYLLNDEFLWVGVHPAESVKDITNDKDVFKSVKAWKKNYDLC